MASYDAIVIGAGHNGLVTALYLARAGWNVLVVERNARVGGAVKSGEVTQPGFIHDLYSTNQNLFLASPVYQDLKADLERHGLRYHISPKPYCNVFPDGSSLRIYRDVSRTLSLLHQHNACDAEGWSRLYRQFQTFRDSLMPLYQTPLPSMKAATTVTKAVRSAGLKGILELGQIILSSTRELGETYFATREARALIATWGMHLDFGPDVSGGSMFPFIEAFTDMEEGMAIAEGGASHLPEALANLLYEEGASVWTGAEVVEILTKGDQVTGVRLDSGERLEAKRAVIANVTPTILFGRLLANQPLPNDFRLKAMEYRYGPGTMMIHLALRGRPQWAGGEDLHEFAYVHAAPYVEDLARTYSQAVNGYLPDEPLAIVGQTSAVDPTRAPGDQQVLWIQVRTLPAEIRGDAANEIDARDWEQAKEPFADRVLAKLERYAPGLRDLVLDRAVYSPMDLQDHNPNLHGGDSVSGSHHLRQNFLWRPIPGWSTYEMPLKGLYMVGAATWPGAGVNAISGYLGAQAILQPYKTRSRVLQASAAAGAMATAGVLVARWLGNGGNGDRDHG